MFFLAPSFFTAQGHRKRDSGGQNLRFACAKLRAEILFCVSLKRRGDFVHPVVTPRESTSSGQKMRLRRSKFAFRLRRATKNASRQLKICVRLRETLGQTVFPAQGHTKRVSGAQNLRFACAKRSRGSRPDCFPCAGPRKTRLRRSKFAFRLRRATKSDDKDAIRHASETWILQKLLRYIWMLRHPETWILQSS